jgi:hypothetical protein
VRHKSRNLFREPGTFSARFVCWSKRLGRGAEKSSTARDGGFKLENDGRGDPLPLFGRFCNQTETNFIKPIDSNSIPAMKDSLSRPGEPADSGVPRTRPKTRKGVEDVIPTPLRYSPLSRRRKRCLTSQTASPPRREPISSGALTQHRELQTSKKRI